MPALFVGSIRFADDGNVGYLRVSGALGLPAALSIKDAWLLLPLSEACNTQPHGQTPKPLLDGADESEHGFESQSKQEEGSSEQADGGCTLPRLARESGYKNRGPCHIRLVFWILSPALLCTVFQQANAAYFNQQEGNK